MLERIPYIPSSIYVSMIMLVAIIFSSKAQPSHMYDRIESPFNPVTIYVQACLPLLEIPFFDVSLVFHLPEHR